MQRFIVTLFAERRQDLRDLIVAGKAAARKLAHARKQLTVCIITFRSAERLA